MNSVVPSPQLKRSRLSMQGARIAILALGLYLLLVNLTGFWLVRYSAEQQQRNLNTFLDQVGKRLTTPPRESFWILEFVTNPATNHVEEDGIAFYRELSEWDNLQDSLAAAVKEPGILEAAFLTLSGEVIMRSDGQTPPPPERRPYVDEDSALIAMTASGQAAGTVLTHRNLEKRVYHPVYSKEGKVVALLRLISDPALVSALKKTRNRLSFGFVISMGILIFLYLLTMRLVRRTIEAERGAAQADRLRALGTMTAGIAHEIRNPLGIISLQVEELRAIAKGIGEEDQQKTLLDIADDLKSETRRLKTLTETFLNFSKASSNPEMRRVAVSVDDVIGQVVRLWSKGLDPKQRRVVYTNPHPKARALFTDDHLRQLLLNLLRNADEALAMQEGEIGISVEVAGTNITITVKDTGPGIDPSVLSQIFDPFFTTRADGTGLGLSLCRALAEGGGGSLDVESEPGKGAAFHLKLRLAPGSA